MMHLILLTMLQNDWIVFEQGDKVMAARPDGKESRMLEEKPFDRMTGTPSPDGRRIAEPIWGCGSAGISIADRDGRNAVAVECDGGMNPIWSADGKTIFFDAQQVWRVNADGTGLTALTSGEEWRGDVALSPKGDALAHIVRHAGKDKFPPRSLIVIDVDGKNPRAVVDRGGVTAYAWSPTGDRIAYGVEGELWIYDLATKVSTRAFEFKAIDKDLYCHGAHDIVWSPDGKAVACGITFLGGREEGTVLLGDREIFVLPLDGKPSRFEAGEYARPMRWERRQDGRIVFEDGRSVKPDGTDAKKGERPPTGLSPDGKRKAETLRGKGVRVSDADGKNAVDLEIDGAGWVKWTPGGRLGVLVLHADGTKLPPRTLRVMDADGKNGRDIVERETILDFAWSPDGKRLAVSVPNQIRVLDADGKLDKTLDHADIDARITSASHAASSLVWSPDGTAIACTIGFLGGRKMGTELFGDDELFIVRLDGKATTLEDVGGRPARWEK